MKKNSFYKKMIMSVAGAALVSVGLNQSPNNAFNSSVTEVSAAKKTKKVKTIGANSAVYQKKGKKIVKTKKTIKVGKKVHVYAKKTVKGKNYYKIGKNQYIKAANVDGKTRKAGKKTVLYTRSGKVIKNRKVRKGQKIKVYGGVVTIKGKKYYSTKYGYIKVSALTKKAPVVKPNNDTSDNTSTPTTTKPVEDNSNGSNGSTAGSNSNGSNSANSSASNSSSSGSTSVPTGNDSSSNNTTSNGSSSNGGSSNGSGSTGSSSNDSSSNSSDNNSSNSSGSNSSDNNSSNGSDSNSSDNNSSNDSGSNSSDNSGSSSDYRENTIAIPNGYTLEKVNAAGEYPTENNIRALDQASSEGMKKNHFVAESKADDEEIVDLTNLTNQQSDELTNYVNKLINSIRKQFGLPEIKSDANNQKLANLIAEKCSKIGVNDNNAYNAAIVEAAKENGLIINNNYITLSNQTLGLGEGAILRKISMTSLKDNIYSDILTLLFKGDEYASASKLLDSSVLTVSTSVSWINSDEGYKGLESYIVLITQGILEDSNENGGTYKPVDQK